MTGDDVDQPAHEPDPDPDSEHVRGLLGDLGPAGPIPPEVSERISAALADLPAPRHGAPDAAADPASRGPRVGRWLVAAAAVVVVGGGGAMLLTHTGGPNAMTSSADSAAGSASPTRSPGPKTDSLQNKASGMDSRSARVALPKVRSGHFAHDVRALVAVRRKPYNLSVPGAAGGKAPDRSTCTPPANARPKDILTIRYDSRLAQLVVTGPRAHRVARAYNCAGTHLLDQVSIGG